MSVSMSIQETVQALGYAFPASITATADGGLVKSVTLAAAKTGTLSTRTDNDTGTLTMSSGHGITTGARLDLYWDGGSQRGITVGTVSSNSVPIDAGVGDNLPAQDTAITAMVPQEEEFTFTGDNAKAIAAYSQRKGIIVLAESDDSEAEAYVLTAGVSSVWIPERNSTVPTASASVVKVFFSHGDSANTGILRIVALYD